MRGKGIRVPFFGEETSMPEIPALLALRTGAKIVPGFAIRERGSRYYKCIIKEEIDVEDIYSTTLRITRLIEEHIRSFYDNWYMFQPIWVNDAE
jgi:KDO2-lipid IV(A) lauroyltransferase